MALVGRPNVGKSTLFNRIVGERTAIVEDRARTTRDRLYAVAEWNGRRFIVVDTGGLERRPGDQLEAKVQEQARLAITEADVIVLVVDAAAGETPADQEAAELLRRSRVPILVAVNKADSERLEAQGAEFNRLGWDEVYALSALHGRGTGDLMDAVVWALPPESSAEAARKAREAEAAAAAEDEADFGIAAPAATPELPAAAWDARVAVDEAARGPISIAIVGRPNVGKSSLLNALLGHERAIVSETAGTTRDAIDTTLEWHAQALRLIDTAGIRRRGKVAGGPAAERYSSLRALKAIGRADVAILVLDAVDGLTAQDAHVAGYVVEEGKGLVVAVNKWDLVTAKTDRTFDEFAARLRAQAPFLDFAPVVSISARTGQRVERVLELAVDIAAERRRRVPTAELNRVVAEATFRQTPPMVKGKRPKVLFATQATVAPPTFVFFARDADRVHFSYRRYLENELRTRFGFDGTPLRLVFRERSKVELPRLRRSGAPGRPRRAAQAVRGAPARPRRGP
ncbi:MAG TPA: ribosome biogenesis GTPase Der [Candidatus Sulfotelmatobacter sp.]|nr:ribosome biogenesis GTPase Der [Candidatus Sulfotelmatobacter sp.]